MKEFNTFPLKNSSENKHYDATQVRTHLFQKQSSKL